MCPRNLFGSVGKRLNMPMSTFNRILEQLPDLKLANFAGLGEPFTHPNIFEMFDIVARKGINILMTTNGTFFTEKNIRRLPDTGFSIHVSIDSSDEKVFSNLRGYSLKAIIDNLKTLKKIRPDINLVIQSLFMKNTMKTYKGLIDLAKKINAKIAVIYPISFNHKDEEIYEPFMEEDFPKYKQEFSELCKSERVEIYDRPINPKPKLCSEPWNGPTFSPKGEVFSCCYVYEARDYLNTPEYWNEWYLNNKVRVPMKNYVMGDINSQLFEEIWNSSRYSELRSMVNLCNSLSMSSNDYKQLRDNIDLNKKKFSYCRVCLWRWNQSC